MRIAHLSDPHVLSPLGSELRGILFNKRITGALNVLLKRGRAYRAAHVVAVLRAVAAARPDHVVVTGDVTNLSLEGELARARELLDRELALGPEHVSVVPGNHDVYTPGAFHARRFARAFAPYATSDLPALALALPSGHYPFVRLRGPVAVVGLTSAVPRPPFVASGRVGAAQLDALVRVLAHPEVARRTPLVLVHHPLANPRSRLRAWHDGLEDAAGLRAVLERMPRGLVLHGHTHARLRRPLAGGGGVEAITAASAAVEHGDADRMAGFNLYELDADGLLERVEAWVLSPDGATFRRRAIPGGGAP